MRKQSSGLSVIVSEEQELDPFGNALYLFCNRRRNILKCVYWDLNGFCLWQKRLEKQKFPWPDTKEAAREITAEQLKWLLAGIDFWHPHRRVEYTQVS
jgi:transposase